MDKIYHRDVFFPPTLEDTLPTLVAECNKKCRTYTQHGWNMVHRRGRQLIESIDNLKVVPNQIFIVRCDPKDNRVMSFNVRTQLDELHDLVLVLSPDNRLITFYMNNRTDTHSTLKTDVYYTEQKEETKMETKAKLRITISNQGDDFADFMEVRLVLRRKQYVLFTSEEPMDGLDTKDKMVKAWVEVVNEAELARNALNIPVSVNDDIYEMAEELEEGLAHELASYIKAI